MPISRSPSLQRSAILLAALLASAATVGAFATPANATNATRDASPALPSAAPGLSGTLKIGAVLPLTGTNAVIGQAQERGAQLAAAEVNHDGGALGKKLVVEFANSDAKVTTTLTATEHLVTTYHVPVVVGEYLSDDCLAMGKYLQRQKIVQINPGCSATTVANIGSYSFSTMDLNDLNATFDAEQMYQRGTRKLAIFVTNTSYGVSIANLVASDFTRLGGKVLTDIRFTTGATTFRSELERLKSSGAQTYFAGDYEPSDVDINKQAYEMGIPISAWFSNTVQIGVQGSPLKTIVGYTGTGLAVDIGSQGKTYLAAYQRAYRQSPTPYASFSFDAVMLAAKAIVAAHSSTATKVRTALRRVGQHYHGVTGTITFDAHGQRVSATYALEEVEANGAFKTIKVVSVKE